MPDMVTKAVLFLLSVNPQCSNSRIKFYDLEKENCKETLYEKEAVCRLLSSWVVSITQQMQYLRLRHLNKNC